MAILEKLGLKPIINASATLTKRRVGDAAGSGGSDGRRAANYVDYHEMQRRVARAHRRIDPQRGRTSVRARRLGCAGHGGMCCRTDSAKVAKLPDTSGMKNEVIVHRLHRNGYDHAVRQVGVKRW
ncbi:MAG: hypothetical protein R2856_33975 [Caldilineaceae bacterium]